MMAWFRWALPFALLLAGSQATTTMAETPMSNENQTSASGVSEVLDHNTYSNAAFLELVHKYVTSDGNVDYQVWKDTAQDLAALDRQVDLLARVSPASHPEQFGDPAAVRSYWINTYNTLVLQAVLEYWPLDSVRAVRISFSSRVIPGKGFFYDRKVVVGGEETNLYQLEKEVLESQKDPRLHFALNCASSSCPVLRPWEWTDAQLDRAARDFVNKASNVQVMGDVVYLSRIFKWYRKDFPEDTYSYLQQFADAGLSSLLQAASDGAYPTKYFDYDWGLNDTGSGESGQDGRNH
jgi:hypothetical protein